MFFPCTSGSIRRSPLGVGIVGSSILIFASGTSIPGNKASDMPPDGSIRVIDRDLRWSGGFLTSGRIWFDGSEAKTRSFVVINREWRKFLDGDSESDSTHSELQKLNSETTLTGNQLSPTGIFDCVGDWMGPIELGDSSDVGQNLKQEAFGSFEVKKPVNVLNVDSNTLKNTGWSRFPCADFAELKKNGKDAVATPWDKLDMQADFRWEPELQKWVGGAAFVGEAWTAPDFAKLRKLTCTKRSEPVPEPSTVTPPIPKPTDESTGTPKPIDESTGITKPIDEPASDSSPKSSAEQSPKPTAEPTTKTTGEPTPKPTDVSSPKPFYCRAWFFIVIAVVVAVVGAIVFVVLRKCTKCMGEEEDDDHDYSSSSSDSDEEKKQQEEAVELDSDSSDSSDSGEEE